MSIPTFLSPSENVSFQNLMERNVIAKPEPNLDLSSAELGPCKRNLTPETRDLDCSFYRIAFHRALPPTRFAIFRRKPSRSTCFSDPIADPVVFLPRLLAFAFAFVIPEPGSPGQSASRLAITETPRKKGKGALRSAPYE